MKGLLLKDWFVLWNRNKILFMSLFICTTMGAFFNITILSFIAFSIAGTLPNTVIAFDEQSKWEQYAITMPFTRKDFVLSKYVLMIIGLSSISVLYFLFGAISAMVLDNGMTINEHIEFLMIFLSVGMIIPSVNLPLVMKLGVEKGRLIPMFLVGFIVALGNIFLSEEMLTYSFLDGLNSAFILVLVLVILGISALLSVKLYEKREL